LNKAFFIDRDGTLNVEVSYLCEPDKTEIIPRCAEAIRAIHQAGYLAVVVTNQAGIARGMYTEKEMMSVHVRIQKLLLACGSDCTVDAFYYCPHHEKFTGDCSCRKPHPGMLLQAASALDIDISASVMVGDRMSDLYAGRNAGCKCSFLVKCGYGENHAATAEEENFPVADDLWEAVDKTIGKI
jgi:D-glycero-D-manno-heptose 1,7-bisphosphate phosphatase